MASKFPEFIKDPASDLSYAVDWEDWLEKGDGIQGSAWTVPTGITSSEEEVVGAQAQIKLSGGILGQKYKITNRVVTFNGLTDERTFVVIVRER